MWTNHNNNKEVSTSVSSSVLSVKSNHWTKTTAELPYCRLSSTATTHVCTVLLLHILLQLLLTEVSNVPAMQIMPNGQITIILFEVLCYGTTHNGTIFCCMKCTYLNKAFKGLFSCIVLKKTANCRCVKIFEVGL